jgi:hypothetical protein
VVPVSAETASAKRKVQAMYSRVSLITSEDARDMESSPGLCPTTYDGLQRVLLAYTTFLRLLLGGYCDHYIEVLRIRRTLSRKVAVFATMAPSDVAGLLWTIFCDARDFFSTMPDQDDLPKSNLSVTYMFLEMGSLNQPYQAPIERLLGSAHQSAGASTGQGMEGGGSTSRGGGSTDSGPPWASKARANESFLNAVQPAIAENPQVRVVDLMDAHVPKLRYKDIKVGSPGSCLDMIIMGTCLKKGCPYSHKYCETITGDKTAKTCDILKKCVTAYVARA